LPRAHYESNDNGINESDTHSQKNINGGDSNISKWQDEGYVVGRFRTDASSHKSK